MLQSIAGSDHPPDPVVVEPSPTLGHSVCSRELHEELKDLARSWLEYAARWPEELPRWLDALTLADQRWLGAFIATRQPWPGTTLLWWNCPDCNSTLAVCGACRGEGLVEVGHGPGAREEQCECQLEAA